MPTSTAYNEAIVLGLQGKLDRAALASAVELVTSRHLALHSHFADSGTRLVARESRRDLGTEAANADDVERMCHERAAAPYNLSSGPLFRPTLYQLHEQSHVLLLAAHHAAADGQSFAVIIDELGTAYSALAARRSPVLPPTPDHAALSQDTAAARYPADQHPADHSLDDLAHWRRRLADPPRNAPWPAGPPRTPIRTRSSAIDAPALGAIMARARALHTTPFVLMFTAFAHAMHTVTGCTDLVLGTHVNSRSEAAANVVGDYTNATPVRSTLSHGATLAQHVRTLGAELIGDIAHSTLPLPLIAEAVGLDQSVAAVFNLNPALTPSSWPAELNVTVSAPPIGAKYDLFFDVIPSSNGALLEVTHRESVDRSVVDALVRCWRNLLTSTDDAESDLEH